MENSASPQPEASATASLDRVSSPGKDREEPVVLSTETITTSGPFVGRWNELVSTTNWDKGLLIVDWRSALEKAEAPLTERSDEAWVQMVGGVTCQHVGRLRRVYQKFDTVRDEYKGLYWSHFQAALDWDDAEMWLEGAIGNKWSVAKMRAARWEAVGAPDGVKPSDDQVIEGEIDGETYDALSDPTTDSNETAPWEADSDAMPESASDDASNTPPADRANRESSETLETSDSPTRVRPFENLAELPDDVAEAFEQFKLVILSHKLTGWEMISRDDLVASLEALKVLAMTPADEETP